MMIGEPVHRTVLALDVEGSTRRERRDRDRLRMRAALYGLLDQALSRAGIERGDYERTDQGDGVLVLMKLFAREKAGQDETEAEQDAALRRMLHCYLATAHLANRHPPLR